MSQTHLFLFESSLSTQEVSYSTITHKQFHADKPVGQHATAQCSSRKRLSTTTCTWRCAFGLGTDCSHQQEGFFPRDIHQVKSKQESLHCLSFLLIDGLHAATEIVQWIHWLCYASNTPGNPQHALVFLCLILLSCPTRPASPAWKQITFMPVMQLQKQSLPTRKSSILSANHVLSCPYVDLIKKKKRKKEDSSKFLTIRCGSSNADSNQPVVVSCTLGKNISISYVLILLLVQISKWQADSVNKSSIKEAPVLTDRQF